MKYKCLWRRWVEIRGLQKPKDRRTNLNLFITVTIKPDVRNSKRKIHNTASVVPSKRNAPMTASTQTASVESLFSENSDASGMLSDNPKPRDTSPAGQSSSVGDDTQTLTSSPTPSQVAGVDLSHPTEDDLPVSIRQIILTSSQPIQNSYTIEKICGPVIKVEHLR